MSGKYTKENKKRPLLIAAIAALAVLLIALLLLAWGLPDSEDMTEESSQTISAETTNSEPQETDHTTAATESVEQTTAAAQAEAVELVEYDLGNGLILVEVGKYTGVYMEDGTDEVLSNVLMAIVRNDGDQDIQYAEITISTSNGDGKFSLSTLPAGESAVLLELNRMQWSADQTYSSATAQNIAYFSEAMSLQEDMLTIQALNGVVNITNVSGEDIQGDIVIYYKNASSDLLYGGITYRVRLEGGLKADEIRQITANHFSESGSRIMFVTIG